MKYPKSILKILNNKIVLYVIIFLAIANILGYVVLGNFVGVIMFLVLGGLTSLFEKNMTVILLVPLVLTSLFMMGKTVKEGLTNSETKGTIKKKSTTTTTTGSNIIHPLDTTTPTTDNNSSSSETDPEPSEVQKDGFKKRNRIDYASTVEEAYGNLSNILGSDGIKGLTDDTHKLMKQQLQLAEAMKSMTPIVAQAQDMLQGLDIKNLGGLADLAKQFTGGNKKTGDALIQQV